jgi:hypothetical protein
VTVTRTGEPGSLWKLEPESPSGSLALRCWAHCRRPESAIMMLAAAAATQPSSSTKGGPDSEARIVPS